MQSWTRWLPFCFLWLLSVPHLSWRLPRSFKSHKRGNEACQSLTLTLYHAFVKATFICFWKAVEFCKQCTIHRKMVFITLKCSREPLRNRVALFGPVCLRQHLNLRHKSKDTLILKYTCMFICLYSNKLTCPTCDSVTSTVLYYNVYVTI